MKLTFKNGISFINSENKKKISLKNSIKIFNSAPFIYLPLNQHVGKPAVPIVKIGENVKIGQLIAKADGNFSSNIHASVSGVVDNIKDHPEPTGNISKTIIIKNDFKQNYLKIKKIKNYKKLTKQEIIKKIKNAGIVGLGGATFPTHLKYTSNKNCKIIILNGIECEPYNTADYIIMKKHSSLILKGLKLMLKASGAKKGFICIEDNKKDIYEKFLNITKNIKEIEVFLFKTKYPQGAEKQLIYALIKKEVPIGKFPIDIGIIVNNVGTAKIIADSIINGKSFTHHYVTLTGNNIKIPRNYLVPIGTPVKHLIQLSKEIKPTKMIISGGIMMGKAMYTDNIPITKGINAFIILNDFLKLKKEQTCVRCSSCVDNCPMFLEPTTIVSLIKNNKLNELNNFEINSCIECGICSYICPSCIPLLDYIRQGKYELRRKQIN